MTTITTLTANRRLAAYLIEQSDHKLQALGKQVWQSPDILPLSAWLKRCYSEVQLSDVVLNDTQAHILWEQIIQNSPTGSALLNQSSTAEQACQAWNLLQLYGLSCDDLLPAESLEIETFYHWANAFEEACTKRQWLCSSQIVNQLIPILQNNRLKVADKIKIVGFDYLPIEIQRLSLTLQSQCEIIIENFRTPAPSQSLIACTDQKNELTQLANWAHTTWQQNPNSHIGCIIPNLTAIRGQVQHIFKEFFPNSSDINISAGESFSQFAIIEDALTLLKLGKKQLNWQSISRILLSPHIGNAETEMYQRALCDAALREHSETEIHIRQIIACVKQTEENYHCPLLAQHLDRYLSTCKNINEDRLPSQWADLFTLQLQTIGWPGQRNLDSLQYQLVQRWHSLLQEFSALDWVLNHINFTSALQHLQSLAQRTLFQAQTTDNPRVQVLGILEAAGMNFDQLWVMGMTDEQWPAPAKLNPFLPITLQRQYKMPHSSAQRELHFAKQVIERLIHSSDKVIFSYAEQDGDRELNPSSLIKDIQPGNINLPEFTSQATRIFQSKQIEIVEFDKAPAVTANENLKGGSGILQAQSACPFQAFARYRLNARKLCDPQVGLDAAERGSLIHLALAFVWHRLENQQNLITISKTELKQLVSEAAENAIRKIAQKRHLTFKPRFRALEKSRLEQRIQSWLELEKERPDFTVVAEEQWQNTQISGLNLHLQVDRRDRLPDGSEIIIDYKTGLPTINDWLGERLVQPQLPLYCVASDKKIVGVVFGQLRPNDMRFKGITKFADLIPGTKTLEQMQKQTSLSSWTDLQTTWREQLTELADEFSQGIASVTPWNPLKSCQYCELQELCRIHEHAI